MSIELPRNPETPIPEPIMASTPEEMEANIQRAKEFIDRVRHQEASYLPRDWFDFDYENQTMSGKNNS